MQGRTLGLGLLGLIGWGMPSLAQVVPDGSLATQVTTQPTGVQLIGGGTPRGTTLFHSFDRFSVGQAESVLFGAGTLYRTIVGRVTGGSRSLLDGQIGVDGSANLLLINPAGIRMGDQVRFNVTGGLVLSTAQSIRAGDGTEFGMTTGAPVLTVDLLPGLQWGTIAPTSTIEALGNLLVQRDLSLVAGQISVTGYVATEGNLSLRSVGDITITGLDGSDSGLRSTNLTIDGGGDLRVTGYVNLRRDLLGAAGAVRIGETIAPRTVTVRGISTRNFSGDGGSIAVTTTGEFRSTGAFGRLGGLTMPLLDQPIQPGDWVSIASQARGNGGGIRIRAGAIVTAAAIISDSLGSGNGGPIALTSQGALSVQGVIDAGSVNGTGGAVSLASAGDLLVGDIKTQGRSSGDISLRSDQTLSLLGPISTEALDGSGAVSLTGKTIALRQTQVTTAGRRGGAVTVTGEQLLLDQSRIVTTAFGDGVERFGTVDVRVGEVVAIGPSGFDPATPVGITTRDLGGTARGGNISLRTEQLSLTGAAVTALNGGAIEVVTEGLAIRDGGIFLRSGNAAVAAGDLRIGADRIVLDNGSIEAAGASGDGANLGVTARSLTMTRGSSLIASAGYGGGIGSAQTAGSGVGGNLTLEVGALTAPLNGNNDLISRATNPGVGRGQTRVNPDLLTNFDLRSDGALLAEFGNSDGLNFRRLVSNDVRGVRLRPPVGGPIVDPPITDPPITDPPVIDPPIIDPPVDLGPGGQPLRFIDRPISTIAYDRDCDGQRYWADRGGLGSGLLPGTVAVVSAVDQVDRTGPLGGAILQEAGGLGLDALGRPVLVPGGRGQPLASRWFRVGCEVMPGGFP